MNITTKFDQTTNPFMPHINNFVSSLGHLTKSLGEINDKTYKLTKEREGQSLMNAYMQSAMNTNNANELTATTNEYLREANSRGLKDIIPKIMEGQTNQATNIAYREQTQINQMRVSNLTSLMKDKKFYVDGQIISGEDYTKKLQSYTQDPNLMVKEMEESIKFAIKTHYNLEYRTNESGQTEAWVATNYLDPITGESIKSLRADEKTYKVGLDENGVMRMQDQTTGEWQNIPTDVKLDLSLLQKRGLDQNAAGMHRIPDAITQMYQIDEQGRAIPNSEREALRTVIGGKIYYRIGNQLLSEQDATNNGWRAEGTTGFTDISNLQEIGAKNKEIFYGSIMKSLKNNPYLYNIAARHYGTRKEQNGDVVINLENKSPEMWEGVFKEANKTATTLYQDFNKAYADQKIDEINRILKITAEGGGKLLNKYSGWKGIPDIHGTPQWTMSNGVGRIKIGSRDYSVAEFFGNAIATYTGKDGKLKIEPNTKETVRVILSDKNYTNQNTGR